MPIYAGEGGGRLRRPIPRSPWQRAIGGIMPPAGQSPLQPQPGAPLPGTPPLTREQRASQIAGQGAYLQRQGQAEQAYQQALAQLQQRKSQTFKDYGFLENGQVDPNNRF